MVFTFCVRILQEETVVRIFVDDGLEEISTMFADIL